MGAYLSSPVCDKDTIEGSNNRLVFAASSMQGWRMSQEDAHNAILNFDENTSLFAVYDGHGGSEIAVYCSRYLPAFLKKLSTYEEGRMNEALIETFIKFDAVLLDPNVKKVLQKLANDDKDETSEAHEFVTALNPTVENHHNDELNVEEAQLLKKEAQLPIEELLKHYNGDEKHFHSPSITKRIVGGNLHVQVNPTEEAPEETATETEASTSRRERKPVTGESTNVQSNSLIHHFLGDTTDDLDEDDDDFELDASDEETSGDEAEDQETDEGEEEDQPLTAKKTAQIQKLMRKSIMAILNRGAKKSKHHSDDVKENQDEDEEEEDEEEEEEDEEEEEEEEDLGMLDMDNDPGSSSGCTAVVTLLRDRQLFVANAGDSRCVVCRAGRAIEMSIDHKPEDLEERTRIEKAGYKVTSDGRVSGGLNLSRAIGDHAYKKNSSLPAEEQAITALPDIRTLTLEDQDEFMIIACDGIWNFMSSQDVVDFVHYRLEKKTLSQICEELFMHCLAPNTSGDGTGCDNMTAIIVKFNLHSSSVKGLSSPSKPLNNKRALSPEHHPSSSTTTTTTTDEIENSSNKKFKILTEHTDVFSNEQKPS